MQVFHSDRYVVPLPTGHRFPAGKYRMLREILDRDGLIADAELREAAPIDVDDLLLVHTASYVDSILHGTLGEIDQRRIGLPWSEELVLRSRSSAGGTLAAAFAALEDGVAGNLGGGTHHAFADHGEGYCTFNDHAVAIRRLRLEGRIRRAAVVDLDVHQGNGTAAIFAADSDVFTFSMHAAKNFPFRKQRSSLDVELPDGCGDREYLETLERHLPGVLEGADIVFYQGGVDPLAEDTLGRLSLTHEGLRARDRMVFEAVRSRALPIVLTLGGGYARPIDLSALAHAGTYREAREVFG
ncbi:MAG: histone deacetylase [Myxococcales bacterium]